MPSLEQILNEARKLPIEDRRRLRAELDEPESNSEAQSANRTHERAWIESHCDEYLGQWVAVENATLIAHGKNPRQVYLAARAAGIEIPYLVRVAKRERPYTGGWL